MAVRVFCNRKIGDERCNTIIASSWWRRMYEDPLATKQRWYCTVCGARYKVSNGVMIQMICDGVDGAVRATFPEHGMQQVKWTSVQRNHQHATTPEALLRAIPEAAICPNRVVRPVPGHPGAYFFDSALFDSIPRFDWAKLLNADFLDPVVTGPGARALGPPPGPSPTALPLDTPKPAIPNDL